MEYVLIILSLSVTVHDETMRRKSLVTSPVPKTECHSSGRLNSRAMEAKIRALPGVSSVAVSYECVETNEIGMRNLKNSLDEILP